MGGTKIIVWQLKDILKTAIFVVLGLAFIILLVYLFVPKEKGSEAAALYTPGTYVSDLMLSDSPVNIAVTVTGDQIVGIELQNMTAAQDVFYPLVRPAMQQITQEILDSQSTAVVIDPEYTVTGNTLLGAINAALAQAEPAAVK